MTREQMKRKEGLALIQRGLKQLGWLWAVDADSRDEEPVQGLIIGTREFIEKCSESVTEVKV